MGSLNKQTEWTEAWDWRMWWKSSSKRAISKNIQYNKTKEEIDAFFEYGNESGMVAPIMILLKKLRQKIENGEYTSILGIDWSGRLPALLFGETLKNIYQKIGIKKELKQYFVAWNRYPNKEYIDGLGKVIDKKTDSPHTFIKERCLVVDDLFHSGDTLKSISKILCGKIPFDIATLHLVVKGGEYYDAETMREELKVGPSYVTYWIHWTPDYYGINQLHGLEKNRRENPDPKKPMIFNKSFISKVQEWRDMELIGYVRKKIKEAAQDMASKFIWE